jgi:hypothetical protein
MAEILLSAISCDTRSEEVPARCRGEESMSNLSTTPTLAPRGINKPFQHLHVEYLINSGPFGYKFKENNTPDVEKAAQHCFDLGP